MTIVEFFDNCSVENVASALICAPDKVILVGDDEKKMSRSELIYYELASARGLNVVFEHRKASRNNLMHNVQVLTEIVESERDCVFDIEGGEDLFLVAVGIVYDKYPDKIQLHRFNIHTNTICDCDADGNVCNTSRVELSVEENIRAYGGSIVLTTDEDGGCNFDYNEDFINDITLMWRLCVKNTCRWNEQTACLAKLCAESRNASGTRFEVNIGFITTVMKKKLTFVRQFVAFLESLESNGLITELAVIGSSASFAFKNVQIMRCLVSAGRLLELKVTVCAMKAIDKQGDKVYNDVRTGVSIDWDGSDVSPHRAKVANEIDVMLMKGLTPVFISCKNGGFNVNELYKISVVAQRFGGKYARKVLIASQSVDDTPKGKYLRARADDMGIRIIDDFDRLSEEETEKTFCALWLAP